MQVFVEFNWNWFRQANKYIEHTNEEKFKDEFDYIITNMSL